MSISTDDADDTANHWQIRTFRIAKFNDCFIIHDLLFKMKWDASAAFTLLHCQGKYCSGAECYLLYYRTQ